MEKLRADMMCNVARDSNMIATEELRTAEEERESKRRKIGDGIHPYQDPGKQDITMFNGLEIVYSWCQQIMGANFAASSLLKYKAEHEGGRLMSVTIPAPTPSGELVVTSSEVDTYWNSVQPKDVIDPSMLRKLGGKELDLRRSLFVTAIHMRRKGWIDGSNEPHTVHLKVAKSKYDAPAQREKVTIGRTFARSTPEVKQGNMVSALNEWSQRKWKSSKNIQYTSIQSCDGWISTVTILPLENATFTGEACVQKKTAEQSAAKKAWEYVKNEHS
eukprot:TRINITY_DN74268_c0_g1_i1.p1 TRINITY_DN74268_c0_g1~~TRINITY_DN74268_c0_g1_i1.p1  ORF type:complete len:306 (-),score=47.84 TRINITY_DN74268_c0_g1_i1:301-1122(-)